MSQNPATCTTPFERGGLLCKLCRMLPEDPQGRRCSRLISRSPAMRRLLTKSATVAMSDAPVVITGESGAGKEVLARAIHANSARRAKPFVAVSCAALPLETLEALLVGRGRGKASGLESPAGGTLFLDEVAELDPRLQSIVLRALDERAGRREGATKPGVRLVCSTRADLSQAVAEKRFREDLYFRLKVFSLAMPPLRERPEDVMVLARQFLEREGHPTGRFTPKAEARLERYAWPGNVRELENAVKHGAVLSKGGDVGPEHLPEELSLRRRPPPGRLDSLDDAERRHVEQVLQACDGELQETARVLGIGRSTLWRKLKAWGVE